MMRVPGLATGMDIESMVNKLMEAERMPLQRMEQEKTTLTWKRDAYRDVNKTLAQLNDMMFDMKLSTSYLSKDIVSSQENAITAKATGKASGTYSIKVEQLASNAINISDGKLDIDPTKTFSELNIDVSGSNGEFTITTFKEVDGEIKQVDSDFTVDKDDTLNDVLKRINGEGIGVRAFFDSNSNKVIIETKKTGDFNTDENVFAGAEIGLSGDFLTDTLKLDSANETGGQNAVFYYNNSNIRMESKSNSTEVGGIDLNFNNITDGFATLNVSNNVDEAFDNIVEFIDKYNEVVEKLNTKQTEKKYRDYKPLSDDEREDMSEHEIELWEDKAKSGILNGESILRDGLTSMRQIWYQSVDNTGELNSILDLGIHTSRDFREGGKLIIDADAEEKIKDALRNDPESVMKLFSSRDDESEPGLVDRLDNALDNLTAKIEDRAGRGSGNEVLNNYTIGKSMKDLNTRISDFERKLSGVEERYWSQFTAMEKAIQRMNQQSSYMMSQFQQ